MVQMTMQVPDELAKRLQPMSAWLPTLIELSLIGFKTLATATATEVMEFLSKNPLPQEVLTIMYPVRHRPACDGCWRSTKPACSRKPSTLKSRSCNNSSMSSSCLRRRSPPSQEGSFRGANRAKGFH